MAAVPIVITPLLYFTEIWGFELSYKVIYGTFVLIYCFTTTDDFVVVYLQSMRMSISKLGAVNKIGFEGDGSSVGVLSV